EQLAREVTHDRRVRVEHNLPHLVQRAAAAHPRGQLEAVRSAFRQVEELVREEIAPPPPSRHELRFPLRPDLAEVDRRARPPPLHRPLLAARGAPHCTEPAAPPPAPRRPPR